MRILSRVASFGLVAMLCIISARQRLNAQEPGGFRGSKTAQQTIEDDRKEIYELQQKLIPLLRQGTNDAQAQAQAAQLERQIADLEAEVARITAFIEKASDRDESERLAQLEAGLAARDQQLAELTKRFDEALKQLADAEGAQNSPPPENAEIKVFALKNVQAGQAAETINAIFRGGNVRVATDNQANSLVVAGDAETLAAIEALLLRLDSQVREATESTTPGAIGPDGEAPRSLLLRVYWLADGLPEGEGEPLANYLPIPVIEAMDQLGLDKPRIVGQIVNSLSRDANPGREAPFNTHVPAVIFKQPVQLTCSGKVWPIRNNTAELDVQISVAGNMVNTDLSGSLATPLGHFMVLGTANSVSAEGGAFIPGMAGGEMGMEGVGRGGYGGRGMEGGRGGGYGAPGGFGPADPAAAVDQPAEPKYNTSHFAFVVQVNEAESFADEK